MSSMTDMSIGTKTSVTVQLGILIAIVVAALKAGGYAERAESRLTAIEEGLNRLQNTATKNAGGVVEVSKRLDSVDSRSLKTETLLLGVERRLALLEGCFRAGKRKCIGGN